MTRDPFDSRWPARVFSTQGFSCLQTGSLLIPWSLERRSYQAVGVLKIVEGECNRLLALTMSA